MEMAPIGPRKERSLSLDILRILAALWVVILHWGHGVAGAAADQVDVVDLGYLGVDVFFMLSGAVIIHTALNRSWYDFARRRFLRLFPVYFVATVGTLAWVLLKGERDFNPALLLHPSGLELWVGGTPVVPVAWTLLYEVNFYILVALFILFRRRLDERSARGGVQVFLLATLIAPLVNEPLLNMFTLGRFGPLFAFGAIVGLSSTARSVRENLPTILVAGFLSYNTLVSRVSIGTDNRVSQAVWAGGILLVSTAFLLWDTYVRSQPGVRHRLRATVTTLSLMTYPVYLLHQEFGVRFINFLVTRDVDPVIAFAGAAVCLLVGTWTLVRLFEPWARKTLRRLFAWDVPQAQA